jgi:hypothetical protein
LRIHYGHRHTFKYSDAPDGGAQIEISIPYAVTGDSGKESELNGELQAQCDLAISRKTRTLLL